MSISLLALAAALESSPLIIDRGRLDRNVPIVPKAAENPRRDTLTIAAEAPDTAITGVIFKGEKAPPRVAEAARAFLGRKADKATLQALAAAMSQAYAKSDVAFYTVAIGAQNFAEGRVLVEIIEGHILNTSMEDPKGGEHPRARRLIEGLIGIRPLSRTHFERQVSLMRDIPGFDFSLAAAGAGDEGGLALTVVPRQKRREFKSGYTSRSTALVGDGQFDASLKLYGVAVDGDELSIAGAASSNLRDFLYAAGGYRSFIGDNGLSAGISAGFLRTRPRRVPIEGDARSLNINVSYPVIRGYKKDLLVSASFDGVNSDNAAFGNVIASERTRAFRAGASLSLRGEKRAVEAALTASQGIGGLGARVDPLSGEEGFAKINLDAGVAQQFAKRIFARVRLSGQYTRDALPATERFAAGGESFGRAFDAGILSADRGVAGSVELAFTPIKAKTFASTEVYAFTDGAKVRLRPRPGFGGASFDLASVGGGLRLRYLDKASLDLEAAKSIDKPFPGARDDWRFTIGWRLSL